MKQYIGVKIVHAKPMNRQEYNEYRGWKLPEDENGSDEGFLVEYLNGGGSNHPNHVGYISWSPEKVFNEAYKPVGGMSFGLAIEALKNGHAVARSGWNGKGMFIVLMPGLKLPAFNTADTARKVNDRTAKWIGKNTPLDCRPYLAMYDAQGKWCPGWLASQTDMLAEDWEIVKADK